MITGLIVQSHNLIDYICKDGNRRKMLQCRVCGLLPAPRPLLSAPSPKPYNARPLPSGTGNPQAWGI